MQKKRMSHRLLAILAATVFAAVALAGCSLDEDAAAKKNNGIVLAKVDDEKITYGEVAKTYQMYVDAYKTYGYDIEADASVSNSLKVDIFNNLLQSKVLMYQAKAQGLTELSAEQQAELDQRVADEKDSMIEFYRSTAEEEAAADATVDVEARIQELIKEEADYYYPDEDYTADEYLETVAEDIRLTYFTELLKAKINGTVSVTDEDVQAWYDEYAGTLKEEYDEDPTLFPSDYEEYLLASGMPIVYQPEGYSRVLHIFIAPEEEIPEELTAKQADLAAMKEEAGELYLAQQTEGLDNSVRLAELETEYTALLAEVNALEESVYAGALAKIQEAHGKLAAGADFRTVMAEYTQDDYFIGDPSYAATGMPIYDDTEVWSQEILEEFDKLSIGQYSSYFQDDDGFHILYYVDDMKAGTVAYDTVKEAIRAYLLIEKQETEWQACIEEWAADKSVTIYSDRFEGLGIDLSAASALG